MSLRICVPLLVGLHKGRKIQRIHLVKPEVGGFGFSIRYKRVRKTFFEKIHFPFSRDTVLWRHYETLAKNCSHTLRDKKKPQLNNYQLKFFFVQLIVTLGGFNLKVSAKTSAKVSYFLLKYFAKTKSEICENFRKNESESFCHNPTWKLLVVNLWDKIKLFNFN
jgi:hypothetical protein